MADVNASVTMLKTKWYEESPGVTSSRRLAGGFCVAVGLAMKIALWFLAVFGTINDAATANGQADGLVYGGLTLLGATGIADAFKKVPS